jgi:glycosyltransferase involved in cell wall biosynthesis
MNFILILHSFALLLRCITEENIMRVLIVNTSEKTGGAAVAANRLMEALKNNGVKAKMLVRDKETDQITVVALKQTATLRWHFLWERLTIYLYNHFSRKHLFEIDIANAGTNITTLREFQEADLIHLHWINQGMLSINNIKQILDTGKPIVWTMHDLWPATALCHYTHECTAFSTGCHNCQYLHGEGSDKDLSTKLWKKKKKLYQNANISFVTCSKWLKGEAQKSGLLIGKRLTSIPNPINTYAFHPEDKREAKIHAGLPIDRRLILFVSQRVTDKRKGMEYFTKAIKIMTERFPEMKENTGIAVLGGHSEEIANQLSLPTYSLGYVREERRIINIYNAVDVFVLPSLEDNLPNTIMEAMACGIPCIGFNIGGIPEMIEHQVNGYVAKYKDSDDLSNGIRWVLNDSTYKTLSENALHKVTSDYSQHSVAMKYIDVYNEAIAQKK